MKKNVKRINESQLRAMIAESIIKVLSESKGKDKLKNSFKSKEDMTQYRDLYEPNASDTIIDTDNSIYGTEYTDNGTLGSGPYMDYKHHTFADGYDYCGDDGYNDYASEYNNALKKRLATKGGQMSYDWDSEFNNAGYMDRQRRDLERDADDRFMDDIYHEKMGRVLRRKYVDGRDPEKDYNFFKLVDDGDSGHYERINQYREKHGIDKPLSKWQQDIAYNTPIDRKRAKERFK